MGMGFECGHAGPSHHAVEDIAVLRTLPGLGIIVPADSPQAEMAIRRTWDADGPLYYSLGKDDKALVPGLNGRFARGHVETIGAGRDIAVVAMGSIAVEAAAAVDALARRGVDATLLIVSSFNPIRRTISPTRWAASTMRSPSRRRPRPAGWGRLWRA